ncbi:Meckel syndrome type 1 protein [Schistosoma japonicum]|nr:Meckel syndrome type 1 protein [Schistosoma japonicum]
MCGKQNSYYFLVAKTVTTELFFKHRSNLYKIMSECPTVGDEKQRKIALAHMDVSTIIKAYQKARFKLLETRKVIEGLRKSNS